MYQTLADWSHKRNHFVSNANDYNSKLFQCVGLSTNDIRDFFSTALTNPQRPFPLPKLFTPLSNHGLSLWTTIDDVRCWHPVQLCLSSVVVLSLRNGTRLPRLISRRAFTLATQRPTRRPTTRPYNPLKCFERSTLPYCKHPGRLRNRNARLRSKTVFARWLLTRQLSVNC